MIRRPPRSTRVRSSAASDVYKRQLQEGRFGVNPVMTLQLDDGVASPVDRAGTSGERRHSDELGWCSEECLDGFVLLITPDRLELCCADEDVGRRTGDR